MDFQREVLGRVDAQSLRSRTVPGDAAFVWNTIGNISHGGVQINGPIIYQECQKDIEKKVLEWLSKIQCEKHHKRAKENTVEGTCNWLLRNKEYLKWITEDSSSIIWLRGDPGTGKTKLTSSVIENFLEDRRLVAGPDAIAYFYCDRSEELRRDPEEIFCALLKQLVRFTQSETGEDGTITATWTVHQAILQDYQRRESNGLSSSGRPDIHECATIIKELEYPWVIIIIDALDEIHPDKRPELLESLTGLLQESKSIIKIFVSGRNESDILREFDDFPSYYIRTSDTKNDIEKFIEERFEHYVQKRRFKWIPRDASGSDIEKARSLICPALKSQANGMFLWVDLQLQQLCKVVHVNFVNEKLKSLPADLEQSYKAIHDTILQEDARTQEVAMVAMEWMISSVWPPTENEIIGALFWNEDTASNEERTILDLSIIMAACHNLIVLDPGQKVLRFIHLSAREYLENHLGGTRRIRPSDTCIRSLIHPDLPRISEEHLRLFDILTYSTRFWPYHLQKDYLSSFQTQIDQRAQLDLETFLGTHQAPGEYFAQALRRYRDDRSGPSYLPSDIVMDHSVYCGLVDYVQDYCLPEIEDINIRNMNGYTALQLAVHRGNLPMVRLLAGAEGVDLEATDYTEIPRRTALTIAAYAAKLDIVKYLASMGADMNTALVLATYSGRLEVVRMLIGYGADVNSALDEEKHFSFINYNPNKPAFQTALWYAVWRERLDIIKLLLDNGADVNAKVTRMYNNPLYSARSRASA